MHATHGLEFLRKSTSEDGRHEVGAQSLDSSCRCDTLTRITGPGGLCGRSTTASALDVASCAHLLGGVDGTLPPDRLCLRARRCLIRGFATQQPLAQPEPYPDHVFFYHPDAFVVAKSMRPFECYWHFTNDQRRLLIGRINLA